MLLGHGNWLKLLTALVAGLHLISALVSPLVFEQGVLVCCLTSGVQTPLAVRQ
jgi:hypothetical protein